MNIGIPVIEDKGLQSPVSGHFGAAPFFAIVNPDTGACRVIPNRDSHHSYGACHPLASLAGEGVDSVAVSGIGAGALNKLQAAGVRVYLSEQPAVEAVVTAFKAGTLRLATPDTACAHHGHGHGECHMGA
jgi:predicted Fe-Mo cluster-binding NifX family protein